MRTLTRARIARIEALERRLLADPEAVPFHYEQCQLSTLIEFRESLRPDGTCDWAALSPETLADLEANINV